MVALRGGVLLGGNTPLLCTLAAWACQVLIKHHFIFTARLRRDGVIAPGVALLLVWMIEAVEVVSAQPFLPQAPW
jgi:hypothetical protein